MDDPPEALLLRCIHEHPGIHVREAARRTGLSLGSASDHLNRLERTLAVEARADGRYKRYFPPGLLATHEAAMLIACRGRRARAIIAHLLDSPDATQRELAQSLGVTRSAVAPVVRSLVDRGILASVRAQRENRYQLTRPADAAATFDRFGASLEFRAQPVVADGDEPSYGIDRRD